MKPVQILLITVLLLGALALQVAAQGEGGMMNFSTEYAVNDTGFRESSRLVRFPPPQTIREPETRPQCGPFFFLVQRGLTRPSDFRRLAVGPKLVSERPASPFTRPSPKSRRIQNYYSFQMLAENGLRRS